MTLRRQRGFTLMEVLASSSATVVVIAAATAFLLKFLGWYDELSAKIAILGSAPGANGVVWVSTQLAPLTVINNPAARRNFFRALLLMLGPLLEAAIAKDLQIHQARADGAAPENENPCQQIQPEIRAIAGCGGHSSLS